MKDSNNQEINIGDNVVFAKERTSEIESHNLTFIVMEIDEERIDGNNIHLTPLSDRKETKSKVDFWTTGDQLLITKKAEQNVDITSIRGTQDNTDDGLFDWLLIN